MTNSHPHSISKTCGAKKVSARDLKRLRAASYARASYDRNGQGSSITTQHRELGLAIERENLEWVEHFSDNDISGSKMHVYRRDFERMLHMLESDDLHVDLLIVYDISRLFRNRRDKLRIESLIAHSVNVLDLAGRSTLVTRPG